jgi:hypothetical protein
LNQACFVKWTEWTQWTSENLAFLTAQIFFIHFHPK